jgi:hypothetical protein
MAAAFKTKADRQAEFDSAPRSPKEQKDFQANEERMDRLAREHFQRQVAYQSERYTGALSRIHDITHAMNVGGAKTVPGRRSVAEHMSDVARLHAELDNAEAEAVDAAAEVSALQGQDPTAMFEAWVRRFPQLADRVS